MAEATLKRLPPRALLTLPDGSAVEVDYIGKGRYTTAWRNSHYVYLQTHEKDASKKILTTLRSEKSPHLPVVELLGFMRPVYHLYRSPLYQPLTAKSRNAWATFKRIAKHFNETRSEVNRRMGYGRDYDANTFNEVLCEALANDDEISPEIYHAVRQLTDEAANYGEYQIEITKKNSAVDAEGNLILLDPLFDLTEVRSYWKRRQQERGRFL